MIILELTEKEAELVQKLILSHGKVERNREVEDFTDHERRVLMCDSVASKVEFAFIPTKEYPITHKDLLYITSMANAEYQTLPIDLHISSKKVAENDFSKIALANALIMWLNSQKLLKRLAEFEFTDHSSDFEEIND